MQETNAMQQGWDFYAMHAGTTLAANIGNNYVDEVQKAIDELASNLAKLKSNQTDAVLGGFVAEHWHAGTFNIDAVAAGSKHRATTLDSTEFASVDIDTNFGKSYSAKYMSDAKASVDAQSQLSNDGVTPKYHGQERLVPSDQLGEAREQAFRKTARNSEIRPNVSAAAEDTKEHLTDVISDGKGVSSKRLTKKESERIARKIKNESLNLETHGVSVNDAIKAEYIMKQAVKAGLSAAAVTVAMQLTPELMKAIDYLITTGHIDPEQLQQTGGKAICSGAESFIRGSLASALTVMCEKGMLGELFKHAAPSLVGTVVTIAVETTKNSIMVAAGKMTTREMGMAFADNAAISAGILAGAGIGSVVTSAIKGATIGSIYPGIGTLVGTIIGSLIGCTIAVVHNISKKYLISFCVDTEFTCFGLVEQNYELPPEILEKLGIDTIIIPKTEIRRTAVAQTIIPTTSIPRIQLETVELVFVRRGVIGVNKIGYVL